MKQHTLDIMQPLYLCNTILKIFKVINSFGGTFWMFMFLMLFSTVHVRGRRDVKNIVGVADDRHLPEVDPDNWNLESGPWLDDFENFAESFKSDPDNMQGDDPGGGDESRKHQASGVPMKCPPVPSTHSTLACVLPQCTTHSECVLPFQRCCNNSCIKTCVKGTGDSVVIDWMIQPDPIDKETHEDAWLMHDEPQDSEKESRQVGSCDFKGNIIPDGTDFYYENHPCICQEGGVYCSVYGDIPLN